MTPNVGRLERKLRVAVGAVLLAAAFFIEWEDWWELLPTVLGVALIATGLLRYCPVNQMAGRRA
jgi:hypothetical protein